ncbi:MAG: succinate dehydrogenase / fumarate reductase, cytochrome b subunit [Bacteroidales bacterium]|jgi:succinate dehydrogenase / fumarate reductase cytochrome b subunit|nr:succinate dehydrogenase / fumarate reductase, cytochrome b subunit [Bacteroidales bacterium]MDN5329320.1 succinate dehydrogenase / fumarate reductase, cytochrome b subunit [Bacteroidales bacterium]
MSQTLLKISSISKKVFMSLAGLFLIVFLVVHLSINLFILPITENHQEIFKQAVEFMTTFPLIKVMEVVLFGAFILHIILGVMLQIENWMARPVGYAVSTKSKTDSPFSRFSIHTGVIIFIFLVIHFMNFYFVKLGWVEPPAGDMPVADKHDFYNMALNVFNNSVYSVLYIVLILGLGFHLHHAFQAAFQSLGLNHPKYTPWIKGIGFIYSIVITIGFISIPLYFLIN